MPKILINEVDNTSAGTPSRYGNYSVLITGYQKEYSVDEVKTATIELNEYKRINEQLANATTEPEKATLKIELILYHC